MNCIESLVGCWRDITRDGIMRTMLAMGSNGTDVAYGTALLVNNSLAGLRAQTQHAHGSKFHPQPCCLAPVSDGLLKGQLQRTAGFFQCIVVFAWPPWKSQRARLLYGLNEVRSVLKSTTVVKFLWPTRKYMECKWTWHYVYIILSARYIAFSEMSF